ncbi:MAG: putative maltokinase, partial [Phycisphaeraceae bacterium]|nr:putative maltokinase [Phycisphaeraceae bacterium]
FWFALKTPIQPPLEETDQQPPRSCHTTWGRIWGTSSETVMLDALREYITRARWFGGKGHKLRKLRLIDHLTLPIPDTTNVYLLRLEVTYTNAPKEEYLLPLAFATAESPDMLLHLKNTPESVICPLETKDQEGLLYDAVQHEGFRATLLDMIAKQRSCKLGQGHLAARRGRRFSEALEGHSLPMSSRVLKAEQSNTSVIYDDTYFLKLYRRIEEGPNPDVVLTQHLTEDTKFSHLPAFAGSLEWKRKGSTPMTIGLLLRFVPNETDAWSFTLDTLRQSYGWALTLKDKLEALPEIPRVSLQIDLDTMPDVVREFIGPVYLDMIRLLGQRTAELHRALASLCRTRDITPEPFSQLYQKSLYQSIRGLILKTFATMESHLKVLPEPHRAAIQEMLGSRTSVFNRLSRITEKRIDTLKIRTHGDYHLGQVLFTGKDFVVIDFEGEPARPMTERHLKQSALRDVAGMIRSFHYAAHGSLLLGNAPEIEDTFLRHWADLWYAYVSGTFLTSYISTAGSDKFIPQNKKDFAMLLETFILEKAVYELGYELNHRPDWFTIPMRGLEDILKGRF